MTLKEQIKIVLTEVPETRNSDIALMVELWRRYYPEKIQTLDLGLRNERPAVALADLYDLPREDHVKRVRAAFNAKGEFMPTDIKVAEARGINEDRWRKALGYEPKKPIFLD